MRVILLSPYPDKLIRPITNSGDECTAHADQLTNVAADWLVSFGYRHIIREPHLSHFGSRIINIHISMLPWNRGADPNFWSWFDRTPKGVSIHVINKDVDAGDVLVQAEVNFKSGMTLRSSYDILMQQAVSLFAATWPDIRRGALPARPMIGKGTFHRRRDKEQWWAQLSRGYDTPVVEVEDMGSRHAATASWKLG